MSVDAPATGFRALTSEMMVAVGFLLIVGLLIIPLPPVMLDILLALSIGFSTVVFLTSLFAERPVDFSVFPTLLLLATLLRLSLNVASTRLILLHGHEGDSAAGDIIDAFGNFVVGGNVAVGLILFLILVIINFVVITKGAGRIAEVSARFTLDAMPGKQMAIDAELNAGTISDAEARDRRAEIENQADFYGSMDGSSKFVRGDAVAGLIITGINLLGGIAIGVGQQDMGFGEAAGTYSLLAVGDGLVTQMPALVVSTAAGVIISRASGRASFGEEMMSQLFGGTAVLYLAGFFMLLLGSVPGLPFVPFLVLALAMGGFAFKKTMAARAPEVLEPVYEEEPEPPLSEVLRVDPLTLEVGYGLLPLVDTTRGGDVPDRVRKLRRQLAQELGIIVPPVRVVDNLQLGPGNYALRLNGELVADGEVMAERQMAIDSAGIQNFPNGIPCTEPVFGLNAFWIMPEDRNRAEARGLTVVDASTVLVTHLAEILRQNAAHMVGRDEVDELINYVRADAPKLVNELVPDMMSLGDVVAVLQNLLNERVSIRNLRTILEALAATAPHTKDPKVLTEEVRAVLWRQITSLVKDSDDVVRAITLDRESEVVLRNSLSPHGALAPDPAVFHALLKSLGETVKVIGEAGQTPCLVVGEDIRRPLYEMLKSHLPDLPVVALRELDRRAEIQIVGSVSALNES